MTLLVLTCANQNEADLIAKTLLEKHLIVCSKSTPVNSMFLWEGKIDSAKEIILFMDSDKTKFKQIEKVVRSLHSYDTFVLLELPITNMSKGVSEWLKEGLR